MTDLQIAFTCSPKPNRLRKNQTLSYVEWILDYISLFRSCCSTFTIYPEFNKRGNLHMHGALYIKDPQKFYTSVLPTFKTELGFCMADTNLTPHWQDTYITKDKKTMVQAMAPFPVPITQDTYNLGERYSKRKMAKKLYLLKKTDKMYNILDYYITQPKQGTGEEESSATPDKAELELRELLKNKYRMF